MLATICVDSRCTLGEGILWSSRRQALLWTDIQGRSLWQHVPGASRTSRWILPDRLGAFAECESGRVLLGFAKSLCVAHLEEADDGPALVFTELVPVEDSVPSTRVNDGRTDRSGNFVFGTLNEAEDKQPVGSFYQFSAKRGLRRLALPSVAIPNSICFSPDGRTMYFCDSLDRIIHQCDYDPEQALAENVRPFVKLGPMQGLPDGSTVDSNGCVWNAEWGTGTVRQYTPNGRLATTIEVPAKNPTCSVFGGVRLDELYITSSRQEMSSEDLELVPHAGGVYRASPGVSGIPDQPFRGL